MHRPMLVGLFTLILASPALAQPDYGPRRLAPGVLTELSSAPRPSETLTGPIHLKELPTFDFKPNFSPKEETLFERSKAVTFRRSIWSLDFAFKPLRMAVANVPQPSGKLARRQIVYMVYRIRNDGTALRQAQQADGTFRTEEVALSSAGSTTKPRFIPHFVLAGTFYNEKTGKYETQEYLDRVMPGALRTILDREIIPPAKPMLKDQDGKPLLGPDGKPLILLNSGQISRVYPLPVTTETEDNSVWGVVTWEIDPRIDYLAVFVQGLSNAFQRAESVDGKVMHRRKTLQLCFWRPGDSWEEAQDRIYFGVPLVKDQQKQARIMGFYQVPGPSLAIDETVEVISAPVVPGGTGELTNLNRHLTTVEIPIDGNLEVPYRIQLDDGKLPAIVKQALAGVGIALPDSPRITTETPRNLWHFEATVDGKKRLFRVRYDPQFWNVFKGRVEFRERVEHFWVYR